MHAHPYDRPMPAHAERAYLLGNNGGPRPVWSDARHRGGKRRNRAGGNWITNKRSCRVVE
eukprot:scaffold20147_cov63-Phaeocystis_antarctica.AAC.3